MKEKWIFGVLNFTLDLIRKYYEADLSHLVIIRSGK